VANTTAKQEQEEFSSAIRLQEDIFKKQSMKKEMLKRLKKD